MSDHRSGTRASTVATTVGLSLLALNLRPAIGSVSPVLDDLQQSLALSDSAISLLTTLPVLCLGVFAAVSPALSRRMGTPGALVLGFVLLIAGILLRLDHAVWALFVGTALAGAGLAIGNVLMPAVIKSAFPDRVRLYTGIGTGILSAGAALSAGFAVPLRDATDSWSGSLALWAVPAVIGLVAWLPLLRGSKPAAAAGPAPDQGSLLGDAMAWQVTGYLALRALVYFTALGWLPTILADLGYSNSSSGALLSLAMLVSVPGALFAPILVGRGGTSPMVVAIAVAGAVSLLGLLWVPAAAALWVAVLGVTLGAGHAMALTFIGMRSPNPQTAAQLSGMVQTIGYLAGGIAGPLLLGLLHGATGGWTVSLVLLAAFTLPELVLGLRSGRNRAVRPRRRGETSAAVPAAAPVAAAAAAPKAPALRD
ncbi:MFS transporter [Streptomyces sp. WAC07149]|uniref:MFS transporter n=1 Tax=Streptomyces sp. WAC07149 TaxID=2487425 RepID=UPI001C8E6347|nr:MFS transporter [Streptomyces sp. WAC07149]